MDLSGMTKNSGRNLHEQESDFINSEKFFTIEPVEMQKRQIRHCQGAGLVKQHP
jgi:hypothetical protein